METQQDLRPTALPDGIARSLPPLPISPAVHLVSPWPLLVLMQWYDLRQAWLPFVHAILVPTPQPVPASRPKPRPKDNGMPPVNRCFPAPEKDVPQLPLPFPGWRILNKSMTRRLSEARWPGWERLPGDKLPVVRIDRTRNQDVRAFCEDNCRG